jgi:YbbR domain-containing protein
VLRRVLDWLFNDWALKLTALALAFLLWTNVRADEQMQLDGEITVRVVSTDADWMVAEIMPITVSAVFRGPYRELLRIASEPPHIELDLAEVSDSTEIHLLRPNLVRMPPGTDRTQITDFNPTSVRISFDRVATRLIPLAVQVRGQPAQGLRMAGAAEIEPSVVRASGAGRRLNRVDSLRLPAIDLATRTAHDTVEITIDTVGTGLIISPRTVRVILPLQPVDSSLTPIPRARNGG